MPSDKETDRPDRGVSKAALANLIGAANQGQRGLLMGIILFAQASGLTLEDLVEVAEKVKPEGEPAEFMEHVQRVRAQIDQKVRDATAGLRRSQMRSVPGRKDRPK